MIEAESYALFRSLIEGARSCVVTTHMHPDGDALGSEMSLARFLLSRGKSVRIVNDDPTPETLSFVEQGDVAAELYDAALHDSIIEQADLILLVDNSAPDRLGGMEAVVTAVAAKTFCIDHHPARDAPWVHNIVDVGSCATAGMIYELVSESGWTPDRESAEAIYLGLATDTGFFRFNSTNARAHRIAADLLELGVRSARTYQQVYERNSLAFTLLLGNALSDVCLDSAGALATVRITKELIDRVEAHDVDTAEITTAMLAMDGVKIVALFRELAERKVKVSLRSKGRLDVHRLATEFGGGGHHNAAGIVMAGSLGEVADLVSARAGDLLG